MFSLFLFPTTPPPTSEIVVTKRVINEGGGGARPSDFTVSVAGQVFCQFKPINRPIYKTMILKINIPRLSKNGL